MPFLLCSHPLLASFLNDLEALYNLSSFPCSPAPSCWPHLLFLFPSLFLFQPLCSSNTKKLVPHLLKCCSPNMLMAPSFRSLLKSLMVWKHYLGSPLYNSMHVHLCSLSLLLCFILIHSTFCHLICYILVSFFAYYLSPSIRMRIPWWQVFCLFCSLCIRGAQESTWCTVAIQGMNE